MEFLFTHYYRKTQQKQRSDNDPSGRSRKRRTFHEPVISVADCSCLDPCQLFDSDHDIQKGQYTCGEDPSRFDDVCQRHDEAITAKRARTSTPHGTMTRAPYPSPPPIVTPMASVMPTLDSEAETMSNKTGLTLDSTGQPISNVHYPNVERFAFTPVPIGASTKGNPVLLNSSVWCLKRHLRWYIIN